MNRVCAALLVLAVAGWYVPVESWLASAGPGGAVIGFVACGTAAYCGIGD